jgi:hypothetical protein
MNERIRELAEQADAYSDAMDIGGKNYIGLRDEYFAELIVRKCCDVLYDNEMGGYRVDHVLKEHFGIE